jgi:fluoride exporter
MQLADGWLLVAAAAMGAAGSLVRYGTSRLYARHGLRPEQATLTVNLLGAGLLGLLFGAAANLEHGSEYLVLGGSLLGGLTTFSTLMMQLVNLREQRAHRRLYAYFLQTFITGLLLAWIGYYAGHWLAGHIGPYT